MNSFSQPKPQEAAKYNGKGVEEKLRSLMRRKDDIIGKNKLTQRLEFGHTEASQYLNHSSQVKGILWNPHLSCFASYDEK